MSVRPDDFRPAAYSDLPLYNIQAVAAATGVPAITLRSWERRYGIPEPKRDPKGYRLYSERDVALTRWLKERVGEGIGISRAVHMLRVLEQLEPTAEPDVSLDFDALRSRLLSAIRRLDAAEIDRALAESLTVASVEDLCLQIISPVLHDVGIEWQRDTLSVTAEHVGSNLVRAKLTELLHITPPPLRSERVLVGCAPGELHDVGALMVALFLRRRGFGVIYAGASVEPRSFARDVTQIAPSATCLSAGSPTAARTLADLYGEIEPQFSGVLGFGGRAFVEHPDLVGTVPGRYLGADAITAVREIERLLKG